MSLHKWRASFYIEEINSTWLDSNEIKIIHLITLFASNLITEKKLEENMVLTRFSAFQRVQKLPIGSSLEYQLWKQ